MGDVVEKLVDYAPVGLLINAMGGDAGGKFAKAVGINGSEKPPSAPGAPDTIVTAENSIEAQSAQRRLARLSRYFTTPTGVLDSATGSQGVF